MIKTFSIIVTGKVQGVFYRQTTKEKAIALGITGTVQNHPDGSVHIMATGTDEQLASLVSWCWHGPKNARVAHVQQQTCEVKMFHSFTVLK